MFFPRNRVNLALPGLDLSNEWWDLEEKIAHVGENVKVCAMSIHVVISQHASFSNEWLAKNSSTFLVHSPRKPQASSYIADRCLSQNLEHSFDHLNSVAASCPSSIWCKHLSLSTVQVGWIVQEVLGMKHGGRSIKPCVLPVGHHVGSSAEDGNGIVNFWWHGMAFCRVLVWRWELNCMIYGGYLFVFSICLNCYFLKAYIFTSTIRLLPDASCNVKCDKLWISYCFWSCR